MFKSDWPGGSKIPVTLYCILRWMLVHYGSEAGPTWLLMLV